MAVKGPVAPFNQEHVSLTRKALRALADAREKISKAQACGMNCDQDLAVHDELKQALEAFQREFTEPPYSQPPEGT